MKDNYVGSRFSRALEEIYGDKNNKVIADKYGYTQQAIGKLKTKKSINETICLISENENINLNWLQTGKGEMLLEEVQETQKSTKSQEPTTKRTIIDARDILDHHIAEREVEILQAYRTLPKEEQEIYYYDIKLKAAKQKVAERQSHEAKLKDVKTA